MWMKSETTTIGVGDTNPPLSYTLNVRFYRPTISMIKYGTYVRCSFTQIILGQLYTDAGGFSLWVSSVYWDANNYKPILG